MQRNTLPPVLGRAQIKLLTAPQPRPVDHVSWTQVCRLARSYTPEAIAMLGAMMRDPEEESRIRIVAATILLDRAWGPPKDRRDEDAASAAEAEELTDAELARIAIAGNGGAGVDTTASGEG